MKYLRRPKKTNPQDWHPADVVAALRKKGTSLRRLSAAHGLHPQTLHLALGKSPYLRGQKIIAEFLGTTPQAIWPSCYEADGSHKVGLRRKPHQRPKSTKAAPRVNGNRRGAA